MKVFKQEEGKRLRTKLSPNQKQRAARNPGTLCPNPPATHTTTEESFWLHQIRKEANFLGRKKTSRTKGLSPNAGNTHRNVFYMVARGRTRISHKGNPIYI